MSREALVLLVCCCDFRDGAERLIPSKSLRNAVIRAFPGLFCILRMCAPRRAAAVVRPRGREKSADRRRRILISRLLIIRAFVPRRKSPFPAYFKGFPAVSPLIPPYPAFLKYPVSPQCRCTSLGVVLLWTRALKKKFPFPKKFCRALFRAAHGAKQIKICRGGRSRASTPFAPAGAKPNKIVFLTTCASEKHLSRSECRSRRLAPARRGAKCGSKRYKK